MPSSVFATEKPMLIAVFMVLATAPMAVLVMDASESTALTVGGTVAACRTDAAPDVTEVIAAFMLSSPFMARA